MATTPMSAISSMSAPVKARPLLGEVVTPPLAGEVVDPLPDDAVMPVAGEVQPE
jgi:hypothetical protein